MTAALVNLFLGLTLSPLLLGIINRVKAAFGGRRGQPLLQPYHDLSKLLLVKNAVYSRTTTWVFRAGPLVGLAAVMLALALTPLSSLPAILAFPGDLILFAYLLGLMRFFTVIAALDTGSSFEGMGASREVFFSMLAEPALFLSLAVVANQTDSLCLSTMIPKISASGPELALIAVALFVVLLCENARIPFDDPNTHLELTMIHEVMVLDHSGPDFAFILYGSCLKLWVLGALLMGILLPSGVHSSPWTELPMALGGMFILALLIGVVESTTARIRLLSVPQLLTGSGALAALALFLCLR